MSGQVMAEQESGKLEWRINVGKGTTERLEPSSGLIKRFSLPLENVIQGLIQRTRRFFQKVWSIGVSEPKKVIHALKVGLALSLVSLFYYMRPLYQSFGGNAMWAVMTVVVVFESTIGATFSKCINRLTGTSVAALLGVGVHWVANQSGKELEPVVTGISVFVFAAAATFSRSVPSIKARFDYGSMIFILTFSLVSVSGYRVDKLIEFAQQRLSTIAIGTLICILIATLLCPIWAGEELHRLIHSNLEKLAESLDGCVTRYFNNDGTLPEDEHEGKASRESIHCYRCVLNSKALEDTMVNFARWEPAHGRFSFRHPWKLYQKIGASMRRCAYCIETISSCTSKETQAPHPYVKRHFEDACKRLSSASSKILRELAKKTKRMTKSSKMNFLVGEMNSAVQQLHNTSNSIPIQNIATEDVPEANNEEHGAKMFLPRLQDLLSLASLVSLLIENASRIQGIIDAFNELATTAEFKPEHDDKSAPSESFRKHSSNS